MVRQRNQEKTFEALPSPKESKMLMQVYVVLVVKLAVFVSGQPWHFQDDYETTTAGLGAFVEFQTGLGLDRVSLYELGLDVAHVQSLQFQVRALRDVHITLHKEAGNTHRDLYDITIGGWANTLSVIQRSIPYGRIQAKVRHHPLNRTEFRDFWITWDRGYLNVGSGRVLGINVFLTLQLVFPFTVNYVSVGSDSGATAEWRIESSTLSPVIGLWSKPEVDLSFKSLSLRGYNVAERTNTVFWLKASSDAHILLSADTDLYANMYWISIGTQRNTESFVQKGRMSGQNTVSAFHSPLSDKHYLPFWITWEGGAVAVGEGTEIGKRQFLLWTDPSPFKVKKMYVTTGQRSPGHWIFELHDENVQLPTPQSSVPIDASRMRDEKDRIISPSSGSSEGDIHNDLRNRRLARGVKVR